MIDVQEAERLLRAHVPPRAAVWCELERAAGAILREDVVADRPQPACDRVAMDGIALASAAVRRGVRRFQVEGAQRAGMAAGALVASDGCLEVMTGTPLPEGADCVVPLEHVRLADGWAELLPDAPAAVLQNVQPYGSDRAAGEVLVRAGTRLAAPHIGIAAAAGCTRLRVADLPSMAVVSTGDEVVAVDATPAPHQVRGANSWALRAALLNAGFADVATFHFPDDPLHLRLGLEAVLQAHDAVVVSGGVSMGAFDLVPGTLAALGVKPHFHRIRQKPGKPFWFGTSTHDSRPVFALPGNPVSALVCLHRYALPALLRACGLEQEVAQATLAADVPARRDLTQFVPVRIVARGCLAAQPVAIHSSADLSALASSHGFVEVGGAGARAGDTVPFYPWS